MDGARMDEEKPRSLNAKIYVLFVLFFFSLAVYYVHSTAVSEIDILPQGAVLIAVFVAAFILESRYAPLLGVLPNLLLLYMLTESQWSSMPDYLRFYVIAGFFLGILSFILYYGKVNKADKLSVYGNASPMYKVSFVFYSLKTILPFYFSYFMLRSFTHPFFMYSFLVVSIITWFFYLEAGV